MTGIPDEEIPIEENGENEEIPAEEPVVEPDTRTFVETCLLGDAEASTEGLNNFVAVRCPDAPINEKLNQLGFLAQDWAEFNTGTLVSTIIERYRIAPL